MMNNKDKTIQQKQRLISQFTSPFKKKELLLGKLKQN